MQNFYISQISSTWVISYLLIAGQICHAENFNDKIAIALARRTFLCEILILPWKSRKCDYFCYGHQKRRVHPNTKRVLLHKILTFAKATNFQNFNGIKFCIMGCIRFHIFELLYRHGIVYQNSDTGHSCLSHPCEMQFLKFFAGAL